MKKAWIKRALVAVLTAVTLASAAVPVYAVVAKLKSPYWDAVDSGKHMDWDNNSKYGNELFTHGQGLWNAYLNPDVIRHDDMSNLQDIVITDYNNTTSGDWGITQKNLLGVAQIRLNRHKMDNISSNYTAAQKLIIQKNVAAHEMGHGLGLDENEPNDLMRPSNPIISVMELTANDMASVNKAKNEEW